MRKKDNWYSEGLLLIFNEDLVFAGKFLLSFIILCLGIFYLPYKLGLILEKWLNAGICFNNYTFMNLSWCWLEGLMGLIVGFGLLIVFIFILFGLILLTIKFMKLF